MLWSPVGLSAMALLFICLRVGVCSCASSPTTKKHLSPESPFWNESIYINLRLYYDNALLSKHHNSHSKVRDYVLALVNAVALIYNNKPLNMVASWHFIVQSIDWIDPEHVQMDGDRTGNSYRMDLGYYYSRRVKLSVFSNLVFLTGFVYRFNTNKTDVKGLAVPHSSCGGRADSAIMVEARSYLAAVVFAHELGHGLGLAHDEDEGCGSGYIMSASTGAGKTTFSPCNFVKLIKNFKTIFDADGKKAFCFRHSNHPGPLAEFPTNVDMPYSTISPSAQCALALGETFTAQIKGTSNICARLVCTNELVNIAIHPAMENTNCAPGKHCRGGQCR